MKRFVAELSIALFLAFGLGATLPCPVAAPTPHIHVVEAGGKLIPSADCPAGWVVELPADRFNPYLGVAAQINMLADASCVREKERK